ncbi:MAG: UDP-2,3-diacylglucosamine diphosphatase [Candidatus Cyclonatronum sp.]|uniref:UDP-2,3-diacylglucosamine diphosphatase n=1 Tax=Cyclonatronum sp. TaxID=3024185 RepID=UPI0025BF51D8|nr:UDP-2,3-diacylglucosamine diphosphatase [Cyclonatronum sp.]MCC5933685.1 UDP-2,3-diacylglucosamine diphosphatase [Balneolales bacterium]MCH8486883.1 UDP-2,3-diacylglucosamine diphosphatase [Cyclonatronum sp.]
MSEEIFTREGDYIFVSDVHLGGFEMAENARIEASFLALLGHIKAQKLHLVIAGDLFDYWMDYRNQWPRVFDRVLSGFEELHQQREEKTLFVTGNHDNWTGPRLTEAGFDLEPEYRLLHISGKKVLVMHGDGLKDTEMALPRPLFHRLLRNPYFVKLYQIIFPPAAGIELMRQFSRKSKLRDYMISPDNSPRLLDTWAVKFLNTSNKADVLLCGHHHNAIHLKTGNRHYINLGNFCFAQSLALHTKEGFTLVKWNCAESRFEKLKPAVTV